MWSWATSWALVSTPLPEEGRLTALHSVWSTGPRSWFLCSCWLSHGNMGCEGVVPITLPGPSLDNKFDRLASPLGARRAVCSGGDRKHARHRQLWGRIPFLASLQGFTVSPFRMKGYEAQRVGSFSPGWHVDKAKFKAHVCLAWECWSVSAPFTLASAGLWELRLPEEVPQAQHPQGPIIVLHSADLQVSC